MERDGSGSDSERFAWRVDASGIGAWAWASRGVRAVFSSRVGGVSLPPYEGCNVGINCGDDAASVGENRRLVAEVAGLRPEQICSVQQVHGWRCWADPDVDEVASSAGRVPRRVRFDDVAPIEAADALATRVRNRGVAVCVADCVPIAIDAGAAVAVVHAGWRGLVGGVIEQTLAVLNEWNMPATRAAIGPCLGPCCFEVEENVAARFDEQFVSYATGGDRRRPHVDLARAAAHVLGEAGVDVDVLGVCTRCDDRCFSHRGAAGVTGRQVVLAWRS